MVKEEEKLVYTVEEVQRMLGVSLSVVYENLHAGRIPYLRLGRRFVIPRTAFHKWLDESTSTNKAVHSNPCPFCRPMKPGNI